MTTGCCWQFLTFTDTSSLPATETTTLQEDVKCCAVFSSAAQHFTTPLRPFICRLLSPDSVTFVPGSKPDVALLGLPGSLTLNIGNASPCENDCENDDPCHPGIPEVEEEKDEKEDRPLGSVKEEVEKPEKSPPKKLLNMASASSLLMLLDVWKVAPPPPIPIPIPIPPPPPPPPPPNPPWNAPPLNPPLSYSFFFLGSERTENAVLTLWKIAVAVFWE